MKKATERKLSIAVGIIVLVQVGGVVFLLIFNAVHKHRYHRDLLVTEDLSLRFDGPAGIELQEPRALARGEELVVDGCLHRTVSTGPTVSQVNVELLSPLGLSLGKTTVRKFSRCKRGGEHFSTRLPASPSDGAVLSIRALADRAEGTAPSAATDELGGHK